MKKGENVYSAATILDILVANELSFNASILPQQGIRYIYYQIMNRNRMNSILALGISCSNPQVIQSLTYERPTQSNKPKFPRT